MKEKYLNKLLYCIKTDNTYALTSGVIYEVIDVVNFMHDTYLEIKTDNDKIISFKVGSKYFLSPKKSLRKIRELKYIRLNKNTES
jgi:rRNA processing protein Gar1